MTQMLLFDSASASNSSVALAPVKAVTPVADPVKLRGSQDATPQLDHNRGLNHMGDLARLVLLRYDLVAKRRSEMAARRAAK